MKRRDAWVIRIGGLALGMWLLAGCAGRSRHEWLTLFFDGVPPLATTTNAVTTAPSAGVDPRGQGTNRPPARAAVKRPPLVFHQPYIENACDACHESKFSQKLKGEPLDVCFTCHDNFLEKAKVKHAPAEAGDCSTCHHPHVSPEKFLLMKKATVLCIDCHSGASGTAASQHKPFAAGDCTACHTPHASDQARLLRKPAGELCLVCHKTMAEHDVPHAPAAGGECLTCHEPHEASLKKLARKAQPSLCFDCHDDVLAKARFKHSPAESGDCTTCHDPHGTAAEHLLVKAGRALCLDCHGDTEGDDVPAHKDQGKTDCWTCHEPHGADNAKFVKPGAAKPTPTPP